MFSIKNHSYHELLNRGTPDFQIELYDIAPGHPRYNMQYHWHNKYEIIYVAVGTLTLQLNERTIKLSKGEGVFIPYGVVHGGTPEGCRYMCVVFAGSILHASQKSRLIMKTQFTSPVVLKDNTLTKSIIKDMSEKKQGYEMSVIGKLYLLAHSLLSAASENKPKPHTEYEKIKPALSYIEEHYYTDITLNELSAMCNMTPNYFCRLFKSITAETPVEYITRYRIDVACGFLLSGMTITDTAYACGFNDTSYFINVFKKQVGLTPHKYKKSVN